MNGAKIIFRRRINLSIELLFTSILILAYSFAWAEQGINWAKADPDGAFVNEPTTITITAQIASDPQLISQGVYLIEYNENDRPITNLGRLYDDGSHGDELAGDNIFTTQLEIGEPFPVSFKYKVSAAYRGTLRRFISEEVLIDVFQELSDSDIADTLSLNQEISDNHRLWIEQYGSDTANEMMISLLSHQPEVDQFSVDEKTQSLSIVYNNGIKSVLSGNPNGSWGYPSSDNSVVCAVYNGVDQFIVFQEEVYAISNMLLESYIRDAVTVKDAEAFSLDFLKTLSNYGLISIATHGMIDSDKNDVVFQIGQKFTKSVQKELRKGRIYIGDNNYILITPNFIKYYAKSKHFPDSIIFLSMCHSLENDSLSSAFLDNGAKVVFGWYNSVMEDFAAEAKNSLLDLMINYGLSADEALKEVPRVDNSIEPPAVLLMDARDKDAEFPFYEPLMIGSVTQEPILITIYGGYVYWLGSEEGKTYIYKVSVNGGTPSIVADVSYPDYPYGLYFKNGYIYWMASAIGEIKRVSTDGGPIETIISNLQPWTNNVFVIGQYIYWLEDGQEYFDPVQGWVTTPARLKRIPANGNNNLPETLMEGYYRPLIVATDESSIYWTNLDFGTGLGTEEGNRSIYKVSLSTFSVEKLVSDRDWIHGFTVDNQYVYWLESIVNPTLKKISKYGGVVYELSSDNLSNNSDTIIYINDTFLYWIYNSFSIYKASNMTGFISKLNIPKELDNIVGNNLCFDGESIYWAQRVFDWDNFSFGFNIYKRTPK